MALLRAAEGGAVVTAEESRYSLRRCLTVPLGAVLFLPLQCGQLSDNGIRAGRDAGTATNLFILFSLSFNSLICEKYENDEKCFREMATKKRQAANSQ